MNLVGLAAVGLAVNLLAVNLLAVSLLAKNLVVDLVVYQPDAGLALDLPVVDLVSLPQFGAAVDLFAVDLFAVDFFAVDLSAVDVAVDLALVVQERYVAAKGI